jgi:TusA-related sulfurtransferase
MGNEVLVDLRGVTCPHGSMVAIQHLRDAPVGSILVFILDDEDCVSVLRKILPLLGQRVIKVESLNGTYRLRMAKVKAI